MQEAGIFAVTFQADDQLQDDCCLSDAPVQHNMIAFIATKLNLYA